jgi:Survival motor neuron (SMN) interacting protein 1 (SIP1)
VENLDQDHPTHVGKLTVAVSRWWKWKMRFVDPLPAQIASMDKLTVLRLLGLLSGGTLLKRGAEVEVGVSRWAWSLLARLPERGELTSEEIGVVRELGKKAVLIGVGLCEEKTWEEGIREVEKDFDGEEHEELPGIVNENEIELDSEDEELNLKDTETDAEFTATEMLGDVGLIGPQLVGPGNTTSATDDDTNRLGASDTGLSNNENERDGYTECASEGEGELPSEDSSNDPEALAAARARILARLDQQQSDDSDTENIEDIKIQQTKDDRASALWNTKATIDMIISVAGEVYGQRDLLEFRGAWDE